MICSHEVDQRVRQSWWLIEIACRKLKQAQKHIFVVTYKRFLRKRLGKHVVLLIFCRSRHNRNLISLHSLHGRMVGLVDMLGSRSDFGQPGQLQSSTVVFKNFAMNAWGSICTSKPCCLIVPSMELPPLGSWKEPNTQPQWWTKW